MQARLILFISLCAIGIGGHSLAGQTFRQLDSLMYAQYIQADWKGLLQTVDRTEEAGYHYYFQQLRSGIAYLQLQAPEKAQPYLQEALALNAADPLALHYLYTSYTAANQWHKAWRLRKKYSTLWATDSVAPPTVTGSFVESGLKVIPGGHEWLGTAEFVAASITHRLGLSGSLQWYYQYLGVRWVTKEDNLGNGNGNSSSITSREWFPQHQLGVRPRVNIADCWRLSGAFHMLRIALPDNTFKDRSAAIQLTYTMPTIDLFAGFANGRLLDTAVTQLRIGMNWRPFGRPNTALTFTYLPHKVNNNWQHTGYALLSHTFHKTHSLSLMGNVGYRQYYIDPEDYQLFNLPISQQFSGRLMYSKQTDHGLGWYTGVLFEQKTGGSGSFQQWTPFIGATFNP